MIKEKLYTTNKKPYELAELMIQGFERLDKKINDGFTRADHRLEEQTELMMGQFDRIDGKIDSGFKEMNKRFDTIEEKFSKIDLRFNNLDKLLEHFNIK